MKWATILGFLVASLVPVFVMSALSPAPKAINELGAYAVFALVVYLYSLSLSVLLGGPVFYLCNKLGLISWWICMVIGFIVGSIISIIYRGYEYIQLMDFLTMALTGAVAGIVFWLVWKKGQPTQSV